MIIIFNLWNYLWLVTVGLIVQIVARMVAQMKGYVLTVIQYGKLPNVVVLGGVLLGGFLSGFLAAFLWVWESL